MGGVLTCTLYTDNGKQEGFVILTISTKKSTFKNGANRAILPKTKKTLPVHVTHGICGMSTYDPLRAIYFLKGEKQRLVRKKHSAVFSFPLNELGGVQN